LRGEYYMRHKSHHCPKTQLITLYLLVYAFIRRPIQAMTLALLRRY